MPRTFLCRCGCDRIMSNRVQFYADKDNSMTVKLGPWYPTMNTMSDDPGGEFGYNPRCLRRDFLNDLSAETYTAANLFNLTAGIASQKMSTFQTELWGRFDDQFFGVHTAGHATVNGDQSSVFSSVVDPLFFLHHSSKSWWQRGKQRDRLTCAKSG